MWQRRYKLTGSWNAPLVKRIRGYASAGAHGPDKTEREALTARWNGSASPR